MAIKTIECNSKYILKEPMQARRHLKYAKNGNDILKDKRFYVDADINDIIVRVLPLNIQCYKDDDKYFFNKDDILKWKRYNEYKDLFDKYEMKNKVERVKSIVKRM
jgi:hypothetical protein